MDSNTSKRSSIPASGGGGRSAKHRRPDPPFNRARATTLGRTAVALAACGVLAATGLAWSGAQTVQNAFHTSDALDGAPRSTGAAENILLIGLDSRKDRNGNDLPPDVLAQLHAGDGQEGGYNTNTLILVHVPADGKNITAFSIPRDDYVPVV
ncbi:transcriptional attenuator, LytR family, partial [Williamsia maris]|nr:transcriptional attenuator, LytR family [Williamsia maris]